MTRFNFLKCGLIGSALVLAACGEHDHHADHSAHKSSQHSSVEISAASITAPLEGRAISAGYFTLENKGADTKLTHVTSPISPNVEIHTHLEENGIMKMRRIDGLELGKGQSVEFKRGGYHLMMFDTALADDAVDAGLVFHFENGETISIIAEIDGRDGGMDHSGH